MKKYIFLSLMFSVLSLFSQNEQWDSIFVNTNSVDNIIYASVSTDSSVIVGGKFTNLNGNTVNYIAEWDSLGWHILNTEINGTVYALTIWEDKIVAGGAFTQAGTTTLNHLGVFDGTSWSGIGTGTNDTVFALFTKDNYLYIGGAFTQANSNNTNHIAEYSTANGWNYYADGPNGNVYAIHTIGNDIFAGGYFNSCGTTSVSNIAKFDGSAWNDVSSGVNDTVFALENINSTLYVGGAFTQAGGSLNETACAAWDGSQWITAGNGFNNTVYTLKYYDGFLYAGGAFTMQPNKPALHIAKLDGAGWANLGDGTNDFVYTISGLKRDIFAGGKFTQAGLKDSYYFARWGAKPKFLSIPNDAEYCEHDNITLSVSALSTVPVSYKWTLNGNIIADSTNSSLILTDATNSWSGTYTCIATNRFGETISAEFDIIINIPSEINSQIGDTASCEGNYIGLYVVSGGTNNTYQWFLNGAQLTFAHDSLLSLYNLSSSDEGYYYCIVSNNCASVTSDSIHLTLNPLPAVSFTGLQSQYCSTDNADTLHGVPSGGTFSGTGINDSIFNPFGLSGNFVITYEYTDNNGCSNVSNQQTTVNYVTPVIFTGLEQAYCLSSENDTLHGIPSGGTFSGAGINDSVFSPYNAGTGVHEITYQKNINGCVVSYTRTTEVQSPDISIGNDTTVCYNLAYTLSIQGDSGSYLWSTGDTTRSIDVYPTSDTLFKAYITTSAGCIDSAQINLSVYPLVNIQFDNLDSLYCVYSDADTLSASPSGGTFYGPGVNGNIFNPMLAGNGTHNLVYAYTDTNLCTYTDTVSVVVGDAAPGSVGMIGLGMEYCHSADPVTLTGVPQGGIFTGAGVNGNTFNPQETPGEGIYFITYIMPDSNSCGTSYSQPVRIVSNPEIFTTPDTNVCKHQEVTLNAWSNDTGIFVWSTGDTATSITNNITYARSFSVVFIDTNSCKSTDTINVGLRQGINPNIGDTSVCYHTLYTVPEGYQSCYWLDLGFESQTLMLERSGNYRVKLKDSLGCDVIDTLVVDIKPTPSINFDDRYEIFKDQTIILGLDNSYDYYEWSDGFNSYLRMFTGYDLNLGDNIFWVHTAIGDCEASDTTNIFVIDAINVNEVNSDNRISLYPNPAKDKIVLKLSNKTTQNSKIEVFNAEGKLVKNIEMPESEKYKTINISDLSNGTYYLKINGKSKVFVKQ